MTRRLIVNADDYGRTRLVSAGIRSAHINGVVTSTTTMMNMPGVEEDLEASLRECPNMGIGVHLILTAGEPLTAKEKVLTLIDETGSFPSEKGFLDNLATINIDQVQLEWDKQIQKFVHLTGKAPDHLDSHHHASYFTAELFKLMLEFADTHQCCIRRPMVEGGQTLPMDLPSELGSQAVDFITALISRYSPRMPDSFCTSFFDQNATLEHLMEILGGVQEGTTELMCHPGFNDPELEKDSSYNKQRDREREILEDILLRTHLSDLEIELINFGDL
jgi:predicted glycoside hydrolase/deacetylase ChbG (UPF0249 family)